MEVCVFVGTVPGTVVPGQLAHDCIDRLTRSITIFDFVDLIIIRLARML